MKGHIQQRGKNSYRLKFDAGRDENGRRKIQYATSRGTKREAQAQLSQLLAAVSAGAYVEPTRTTVGDFVASRIDQWESSGAISARSAARYREILANQITPHLGTKLLQKLRPLDIERWHTALRSGGRANGKGLTARSIGQAHRVLFKALNDAMRNELITKNVAKVQGPKVEPMEIFIVQDIPAFIEKLKTAGRLYVPAMVSLFTGMRLGEVLALRWSRVDSTFSTQICKPWFVGV
jgi:integrase